MRWTWSIWVALSLSAGGCAPLDFTAFVPQHPARSRVVPEPPGAACPHGGQALQTGLDLNEDGELGADEVTATEYACARAPTADPTTPPVLVRTERLVPGAECPEGGQVTRAGLDANNNDTLEAEEVSREVLSCLSAAPVRTRIRAVTDSRVCMSPNASVLEAGEDVDGNGVLDTSEVQAVHSFCDLDSSRIHLQLQAEPAGGACARPGTRVSAFSDLNGNGQQDTAMEPTAFLLLCQPTRAYEGTYVVTSAADLAALQGVTRVNGDLIIYSQTLPEFVLPELSVVVGSLSFQTNPLLTRVELPNLRFARDVSLESNAVLSTASIGDPDGPQVYVDRTLVVRLNPQLASLDGLRTLAPNGELIVADNDLLETFEFPYINGLSLGGLIVQSNPRLRTLSLPLLESLFSAALAHCPALESLSGLSSLRTVEHLSIFNNAALTSLEGLDSLQSASSLTIAKNAALKTTEGLPRLARVGSVLIGDNATLEFAGGMPSLRTVSESFTLRNNASLRGVKGLPKLDSVQTLILESNPLLTDLGGFGPLLRLERLTVRYNRDLRDLSRLSELRFLQFLKLTDNANLTDLGLMGLVAVEQGFSVENNPLLPTCRAQRLATAVYSGAPTALSILGNDSQTACPP
ncbi:MAG: leucine-rich repeat domain-containing protein [Myxococcaceae bacterium]|nr:MAG: leucine-rich repeat domain-containing protein [Myxococcaceae bacterium]